MLSPRERDELLERQARVYELLDVATKPEQWLLGGLKLLGISLREIANKLGVGYGTLRERMATLGRKSSAPETPELG